MQATTAAEWEAAKHPYAMIYHPGCRDERRRRLLSVACARRGLPFLEDPMWSDALAFVERWADGEQDNKGWKAMRRRLRKAARSFPEFTSHRGSADAVFATTEKEFGSFKMSIEYVTHGLAQRFREEHEGQDDWKAISDAEALLQASYVRDIFPNPFTPVEIDPGRALGWALADDAKVQQLATGIYASQDYAGMVVLADALEQAGCDVPEVLAACRGGVHVRGCWVVDAFRA